MPNYQRKRKRSHSWPLSFGEDHPSSFFPTDEMSSSTTSAIKAHWEQRHVAQLMESIHEIITGDGGVWKNPGFKTISDKLNERCESYFSPKQVEYKLRHLKDQYAEHREEPQYFIKLFGFDTGRLCLDVLPVVCCKSISSTCDQQVLPRMRDALASMVELSRRLSSLELDKTHPHLFAFAASHLDEPEFQLQLSMVVNNKDITCDFLRRRMRRADGRLVDDHVTRGSGVDSQGKLPEA
ncbi:uncharacterized protein LOC114717805 [Neltuma alba]|uniref:uncharacterized protein LOC114717805 n=1 Tax=Neltuma alba TaxID=207710 RepID=UPI0010A3C1DD|nr:uncharacterized protein LOC114717805 [Prosopis alba]XP_028758833.1 uncharacterized protein LOC114717805 [Prosopis alba]XP_028758834.1 uncharacterized protein LOC114717805 [Prosopis alba]XP_028758835.1 uncharacterized protein LOC114717805 [Prosopis alba]